MCRDKLGRYVLALGGIEPRKASIDLIEAFALLRAQVGPDLADLRLVFGGGETLFDYRDYRAAFEAARRRLGVQHPRDRGRYANASPTRSCRP